MWIVTVVVLTVVVYLALTAYFANLLTTSVRNPLLSVAADIGMPIEAVQFPSAVDNIPLEGWLMRGTNGKTIIVLHAKDGTRDDPTIGLPDIERALVQHGYTVLAFDFRGHGESGGNRVSIATLEPRDVSGAL